MRVFEVMTEGVRTVPPSLPATEAWEVMRTEGIHHLVVTLDKSQRVYLGNDPVSIHELGARIHAQLKSTQRSVFLRCDETVPFGAFASVIDALRQSGINNISIVTEPLTERARTR